MVDNQIPTSTNSSSKRNTFFKFILILLVILGFITAFGGGYFLKDLLKKGNEVTQNIKQEILQPSPSTNVQSNPQKPIIQNEPSTIQETTKFLPGKHYIDDTVIAVTKDKPNYSIVATVTRQEQDSNYAQNSRVSYFDGNSWVRKLDTKSIPNSTIVSNSLVRNWTTNIDSSRVLKETDNGEININNSTILFSTGPLQNEIGIRSLPGYTKFLSKGDGTLTVNGTQHPAYILYSRIYSLNSSDIQFYNQPFGVTTDWLIFWDTDGNMYHLDATEVSNPTLIYQTHELAILDTSDNSVIKTFQANVTRDSSTPPNKYTISFGSPISGSLTLNLLNSINKAPDNSFKWFLGQVSGTIQKSDGKSVQGIGLVEYIHN